MRRLAYGFVALVAVGASQAVAQVPRLPAGMTPEQAAQLVQQRPELGDIVRRQLQQSGATPDQIRARLRAFGYPSELLDAYLGTDSIAPPDPDQPILQAISALRLGGFSMRDSLLLARDTLALRMFADSLRADSITAAEALAALRPLELFGLNVFRSATTQFQPIPSGPVDESYSLGPGDLLVLILTGEVELAYSNLEVTRTGFIVIPQVGQIFVNNLTLGQLRDVLYSRLRRVYSGVTRGNNPRTRFEIGVANMRIISVRVLGEVALPGTYQVSAASGVLSAIYNAGGLLETSNFRSVEIRRGTQSVATLDLYQYLSTGSLDTPVRLQSGDVLFVPTRGGRVKIAGEVVRPGIYEIQPDETLRDLVGYAGGLTETAAVDNATIARILPPRERQEIGRERRVFTVALESVLDSVAPSVSLAPGDSVTVFSITSLTREAVTIDGAVWQPGTYRLEAGMRASDLVEVSGGLRPEAFRGRVQILRTLPDSSTQMLGLSLNENGEANGSDPLLQEFDEVTVFSVSSFRPQRFITVSGAVMSPGLINFADSMTLKDAILLAGGLTDAASLTEAEVSRLLDRDDVDPDSLATVLMVPLDSSYVVDRTGRLRRAVGAARAPTVMLEPYDNVFIRRQPGWEPQRNVMITGEVQFPGKYTLLTKHDRLSDILDRSGGLTDQAYSRGVRFFRSEGGAGRIAVDLPDILAGGGSEGNLVLAHGDSIHIPAYTPTVRVEGAVNSPSSVAHMQGKNMRYYIDAAGGYRRDADENRRFVQQPNGLIERRANPEPGATLTVPAKDPDDRGIDALALFTNIAQIFAATATVIVVLVR